jgi:hypothetical protein
MPRAIAQIDSVSGYHLAGLKQNAKAVLDVLGCHVCGCADNATLGEAGHGSAKVNSQVSAEFRDFGSGQLFGSQFCEARVNSE